MNRITVLETSLVHNYQTLHAYHVPYYQSLGLLLIWHGGNDLQTWWAAGNVLNTKRWKTDKGWFSLYEVGNKAKNSSS
jgi:hypothetical protein